VVKAFLTVDPKFVSSCHLNIFEVMMRVILLLVFLLSAFCSTGQENNAFQAANKAYNEGNYTVAITTYKQLLTGGESSELHYNLGNAYYKNQQLGEAILHFEKALKLNPGDKNIIENLAIAKEAVELEVLQVPTFFVLRMWRGFYGLLSSSAWVILQMLWIIGLLYGLYLWTLSRDASIRVRGLKLIAVLLPLLLLSYFAGRSAHYGETAEDDGVVLRSAPLVNEPLDKSETLEELTPGVKVEILDQLDAWYKVGLANKAQGWVKKDAVGII